MYKLPKIKTLVVDDDEIISAVSGHVAQSTLGHTDICNDPKEAKQVWLQQNHELILLDLQMPEITGQEFCTWVRNQPQGKNTFILICTADTRVDTFRNILKLGANDYITKPLDPHLLALRLEIARHTIHTNIVNRIKDHARKNISVILDQYQADNCKAEAAHQIMRGTRPCGLLEIAGLAQQVECHFRTSGGECQAVFTLTRALNRALEVMEQELAAAS